MGKKIVVLTGSPRKNGNSSALAESFIKAAERNGCSVTRFDAAELSIKECRGCRGCYGKGLACAFGDDFNKIAPALETADGLVLAAPVYWYSFPACLKAVIDKFYALFVGGKSFAGKKCALLACCADKPLSTFDGLLVTWRGTIRLMRGEIVGEVLIPGVAKAGDIQGTDGLRQAEALAEKFA